jgi:hypothetical protein
MMLTTLDILKLCVPFLFALILIWAKEWYVTKKEREQKQDALWRILIQDSEDMIKADDMLQEMAESYAQDKISPRIFLTSFIPVEYARRLAELDHKYAYLYSAYEIEAEGSRKRDETLEKLRDQFYKEPEKHNRETLAKAIQEQINLARNHPIFVGEKIVAILERIQKARRKDAQPVTQYRELISQLQRRIDE